MKAGRGLLDKVVLITGASSGFGAATARLLASEGAKTVLAARRLPRLEALASEIRMAGGEALPVSCDVTDQIQITRLVEIVMAKYGRIDVLVNNAGVARLDWLDALSPSDISQTLDVDLKGAILMARAVLPTMLAQREGHIINIASVVGWVAPPLASVYAAAKFGLRGFTESLRREAAPFGVRISAVYPAGARTEFADHVGGELASQLLNSTWVNVLTEEDVARAIMRIIRRARAREVVLPWWYSPILWLNSHFRIAADFLLIQLVRHYRKLSSPGKNDHL